MFFNDIFVIDRCPFESALSYCNTHINNGDLNVYNKQDYLKNTVAPYSIPIPYFIQSLKYFEDFYLWVDKYFPTVRKVSYSDLVYDTDSTFDNLLNLPSSTISITNFNKFNFLKVRDSDISKFSKEDLVNIITINDCANALLANNLYHENTSIPIKKITLAEKLARITNFNELLDTYNTYPSNHFTNISKNELDSRIEKEQNFWIT
jgi:hypothetical protein